MTEQMAADMEQEFSALSKLYASGIPEAVDPYPMYREFREKSPVMNGDLLARYGIPSLADYQRSGRQIYTLFRYEDVARALRDEEHFTARIIADGLGELIGEGVLEGYSGEEHRKLRGVMNRAFTPVNLRRLRKAVLEPRLRGQVAALLDRGGDEFISAFALRFPIDVVYRILGYPDDRELSERFVSWGIQCLQGSPDDPSKLGAARAAAMTAAQNIFDTTLEVVKRRRAEGAVGEDIIAHMIRGNSEGIQLCDVRIAKFLSAMIPAATETTTRSFANMLVLLISHPTLMDRLRGDRTLMNKAITETMRFEPTAGFTARETKTDVEICGIKIPAKTALSLCIGSANRDETIFPNADVLDIDRISARPNLAFAFGPHICLGQLIARQEIDVAMNAVLDILPRIRFDPEHDQPLIRGFNMRGPDALHLLWN